MKDVFISRPNWIPENCNSGLTNFYKLLDANDLNPRTIGQSDYPNESPLTEVLNLMKKCEGTVVLGVPQVFISEGIIKNENVTKLTLGTEWNHIETALAHVIGHPVLIIHDISVTRGVFDRGATSQFLYSVNFKDNDWALTDSVSGAIKNWKSKLQPIPQNPTSHTLIKEKFTIKWGMYKFESQDGLYCPVCYEKDNLKILASRINSQFYQCPNCNAKLS